MMAGLLAPSVPWVVWAAILPLAAAALVLPFGRHALALVVPAAAGTVGAAVLLTLQVWRHGPLRYALGSWEAPLGIELQADGLSAAMVLTTAAITAAVAFYARSEFTHPPGREDRATLFFWPLLLFLWGALNAMFLGADLFNLYVAIELLGLAAVALVTLKGGAAALVGGMRYLLTALLGSIAYLLGVALLYGAYGVLDMDRLATAVEAGMAPTLVPTAALVLMTVGLMAKTALFPLHFWLPPAHSAAPTPASALLSALVVKASFYLIVRLWFDVLTPVINLPAAKAMAGLGAAAILWGSVLALRQERLKLLVAYSTVAQLGYLFLMFPLAGGSAEAQPWAAGAWTSGIYQAISHAFAKGAMFLAAGTVIHALGHDRMDGMTGLVRHMPATVFAFGLAGLSLMGLPPSGGFIAKWLLLTAAFASGQWWWAMVVLIGGLLAAGYVFRPIARSFAKPDDGEAASPPAKPPRRMELIPLALALVSVMLGVVSLQPFLLLQIGRPDAAQEGLE